MIGRDPTGKDIAVRTNAQGQLIVDIGGATLDVTADGVEIKNDAGNPIPVADAGSSLTVDGKAYRSTVSITRPSNTTAYAVGGVIGNSSTAIHTLSNAGPNGGFVLIQSVALMISEAAIPSGMGAFRIHLYSASPAAIADNALFDLVSGDRSLYMGYVDMPAPQDLGSTIYAQSDYVGRLIKLTSANLFVQIETRGAYTPASGSVYELRFNTMEAGL